MISTKTASQLKKILLTAIKPIRKICVSKWADTYRMLPSDAAEPGRWKTSRAPYTREVMDAFTQEGIKRVVIKSSSQIGKALDIATPIATPEGFKLMGELQVGDKVFDECGEVCNVIAESQIMHDHDCYEVTFSDGVKIVADAGHRWRVQEDKRHGVAEKILTTEEIALTFKNGNRNRYAIPVSKSLNLPKKDLPIEPYTLGAWLGDGNSCSAQLTLHEADIAIARRIEAEGYNIVIRQKDARALHVKNIQIEPLAHDENFCIRGHDMRVVGRTKKGYCAECSRQYAMSHKWKGIREVKVDPIINPHKTFYSLLRTAGLINNKHIPEIYLRGSFNQRLELLRGIMDTDGSISRKGRCEITLKSQRLIDDVCNLLWTLGFKPTIRRTVSSCVYGGKKKYFEVFRLTFLAYDDVKVFSLERKAALQKSSVGCRPSETFRRRIINVQKVSSRPVKCIAVDSPNHLYLAGHALIPTHNTEILLNVFGRFAHIDPCSMMMIQPTLELAQDFSKSRLSAMIADTKELTPLFYGKGGRMKSRDATQTILSKFFVGGRIVLTGANSPANLASRPIRILLCDEVDRFPQSAGGAKLGEGDPVELAARRTTTYWNYKIGMFSTPTIEGISRIDAEYLLGTQEEWQHKCPNCGEYHSLDYRQMQVDYQQSKDKNGQKVILVNGVKWRCPDCGFEFDELQIKNAPQKYVAQNPDAIKNGIRSFWLNGFSSPWLTWANIMTEWLKSRGNPEREQVVYNTLFGLSYQLRGNYDDENVFLERREDYEAELPTGVLLLTAAVDVQANRLEYEIVGWAEDETRWGILRGIVRGAPNQISTWQELDRVLDRTFYFGNGTPMTVARTFIDSGYSTTQVYEYCKANVRRGRYAIKGKAGMGLALLHQYGHPKQSNVLLTILGVDAGKQTVMSNLGITDPTIGGYMHFPRDDEFLGKRGYDSVYFKQLISEHTVVRKSGGILYTVWEPVVEKARNESLDLAVYSLAAMKSCIGRNNAAFWARRRELLKDEFESIRTGRQKKKKAIIPKATAFREVDIWS